MPASFKVDERTSFILPVIFHRPGSADPVTIRYTVSHKKMSEVTALEKAMRKSLAEYEGDDYPVFKARAEARLVMGIAQAWDCASNFDEENIADLFDAYPAAYPAFTQEYSREMMGLREKS